MALPTLEFFSDWYRPGASVAVHRLRRVWLDYAGRGRMFWRAFSLDYINERVTPKPIVDAEISLLRQIEPQLPIQPWPRPDWQWPVAFWPAFEALACAQAQGHDAAFAMSWALRHAFFTKGSCLSLRHELLAIAAEVAPDRALDLARFEDDWDSGRHKAGVIADSRRGWHDLRAAGSPTFVLRGGRQVANPAAGRADIDKKRGVVRSYTPYTGDPLAVFRELLDAAAGTGS